MMGRDARERVRGKSYFGILSFFSGGCIEVQ